MKPPPLVEQQRRDAESRQRHRAGRAERLPVRARARHRAAGEVPEARLRRRHGRRARAHVHEDERRARAPDRRRVRVRALERHADDVRREAAHAEARRAEPDELGEVLHEEEPLRLVQGRVVVRREGGVVVDLVRTGLVAAQAIEEALID